jgi:hypothetical protein
MKRLFLIVVYLNSVFNETACGGDMHLAVLDAGQVVDCNDMSTWPKNLSCCNSICVDAGETAPCSFPDGGKGVWKLDDNGNVWCVASWDNP